MSSFMVFGALALAAVFAASFLWASHMARDSKEEVEGLRDEVRTAHEDRSQLQSALSTAKLEHARRDGHIAALEESLRQHSAMTQQLRAALAEAGALKEEARKKLMAEVAHSHELNDKLSGALMAMNEVSQAIIDLAQQHRGAMERLLEPAASPVHAVVEELPPLPQPESDHGLADYPSPAWSSSALSENGAGEHAMPTLDIGDDHPLVLALSQRAQSAEAGAIV